MLGPLFPESHVILFLNSLLSFDVVYPWIIFSDEGLEDELVFNVKFTEV